MSGALTMSNGYTVAMASAIQNADHDLIGVRLGAKCLAKNVSVTSIAKELGVTRQTVYSWFTGRYRPHASKIPKIRVLLVDLR